MRPKTPREVLVRAGAPAMLVTSLTNIRYLTGCAVSAGALLVLPKKFHLFVDDRYRSALEKLQSSDFLVSDVRDLLQTLASIRRLAFESDDVIVSRFASWKKKFKNTKFVHTSGVLEEFRRSKEPEELMRLRRAERITEELLRRIPSILRKGISELEVARRIQIWALELGAEGLSFDPIVAFGTHTSRPHHHPTNRTLRKGHIVQIDIGAKFRGYSADRSEVYFTARPTELQERVHRTLKAARDTAMHASVRGASVRSLDRIARVVLRREGMEDAFCHALGHGVGLDIHEGVTISSKAKDLRLLKNEVITIEPGVYFPGKFGMRLESMVYVI